ncbi:NLR family CARD domain-containing protein 3, partial [Nibea albiflora]
MEEKKKKEEERKTSVSSPIHEAQSSSPSCVSMKSDRSMFHPVSFEKTQSSRIREAQSSSPSCVSMKSDRSMFHPISFEETQSQQPGPSSCSVCEEVLEDLVQLTCGHWSCKQCVSSDNKCMKCGKKFRRDAEEDTGINSAKKNLKEAMKKKCAHVSEGNGDEGSSLNSIYTDLYMTTGESAVPHEEHGFRHVKHDSSEKSVNLSDIFKPLPGQEKHRTVLTKGVAGIGKSFAVQKFILDWAEGKANQDTDFIFSLAFRESFKDSEDFVRARVTVILDGLDESRLQLDFKNKPVTSVSEVTSVGNLLTNLIQGNLLPQANLWITSRPAAADQIPGQYVDVVTEIRGFSDPQKEEYFSKRF